jgi:hypothetical protein
MARRQRGSGTAAVLALVLALVLGAPFGPGARGGASTRPGAPAAPGVEPGVLTHPAVLALPSKAPAFASRTAAQPGAPMPWWLGGATHHGTDPFVDDTATVRRAAAPGPAGARSWWGRAPPQTSV